MKADLHASIGVTDKIYPAVGWRRSDTMSTHWGDKNWQAYVPAPVCDAHPEWTAFYYRAWELAYTHIKDLPGMPQTPYMDEAFCATQLWIWDSCFMSLFCKYAGDVFPGVETLDNFYGVLYEGRHLPTVMPPKEEPAWTGAVWGVPHEMQIHIADNPPLFAWAEYEDLLLRGDVERIRTLLHERRVLQKHYAWIEGLRAPVTPRGVCAPTCLMAEEDESGYRWEGGCSGMDNTPRGRTGEHADRPRPNAPDMLWIDAICQQALAARMLARLYEAIGEEEEAAPWRARYEKKKETVNALYWDDRDGFYYDIDRHSHAPYRVMSIASYWTLTAGIATPERAAILARHLEDPATFGGVVPFPSVARSDNDYMPSGRYWRGGVWLPTAYATLRGLSNYGMHALAHRTATSLLDHMYRTYQEYEPHTIWECYHPEKPEAGTIVEGEAPARPDFCGWSALGPISIYLENVLGFHTIDALKNRIEWEKPDDLPGQIGIRGLRFGKIRTDIVADAHTCHVQASAPYTLVVCGRTYAVTAGENTFPL